MKNDFEGYDLERISRCEGSCIDVLEIAIKDGLPKSCVLTQLKVLKNIIDFKNKYVTDLEKYFDERR